MKAEMLMKILERVPGDYDVEIMNNNLVSPVSDKVEIDVEKGKIILK